MEIKVIKGEGWDSFDPTPTNISDYQNLRVKLQSNEHRYSFRFETPDFVAPAGFANVAWRKNKFESYELIIEKNSERYLNQARLLEENLRILVKIRNSFMEISLRFDRKKNDVIPVCEYYIYIDEECWTRSGTIYNFDEKNLTKSLLYAFAEGEYYIYRNDKTLSLHPRKEIYY